jgi:hypothetical protein
MSDAVPNVDDEGVLSVRRRTILKGAAWSVPAVMVAQLPSWAAHGTQPVSIDFGQSTACKIPGASWKTFCYNKGYVLWAVVENTTADPVIITGVTNMKVGGVIQCVVGMTLPSDSCSDRVTSVTIPRDGDAIIGIFSNADSDSSSDVVSLQLTYTQHGVEITTPILSGTVIGSPWTTGGGSCKFPAGCVKRSEPLTACDTRCATIY